jgi:Mg-chelatase subunit ChlD
MDMSNTTLVPGSLSALAAQNAHSLAEAFVNARVVVIADVSGSMHARDARGGQRRYEVAQTELTALQREYPGQIAVVAFADYPQFCPTGILPPPDGSTNLRAALRFAKVADVPGIRVILISDGLPDDAAGALAVARTYTQRIDVIYVGHEDGTGREFLARLAQAAGGTFHVNARATNLLPTLHQLMLAAC